MAIRIQARLVDRSGNPVTGLVQVLPIRGTAASAMTRTLDATGGFTVDTSTAQAFRVTLPSGRVVMVDVSSQTPTVTSDTSADERLRLTYAGDAAMQGETPETMTAAATAASAKATNAAAKATSDAASAATVAAAAKAAADAAQARKVGLVIGRTAVPNLAVGVDTTRTITWTAAAPVAPTTAVALLEPAGTLLGQITATLKPASLTTTGCEVVLRAPLALGLGSGNVAVVAAFLS